MNFCESTAGIWGILGWVVFAIKIVIPLILIVLGAIVGNYIQQNKQIVKDRLKNFIDRF